MINIVLLVIYFGRKTQSSQGFDDVWLLSLLSHWGLPQEMSDLSGGIRFGRHNIKLGGECKAEKVKSNFFENNSEIISNNICFQGQYFDGRNKASL